MSNREDFLEGSAAASGAALHDISKVREDFSMRNLFKRESAILVRGG
jgi:hypothetical protein